MTQNFRAGKAHHEGIPPGFFLLRVGFDQKCFTFLQGGHHGKDAGDILRPGTATFFLWAANELGANGPVAWAFQKTDSFGATKFVGAAADKIAFAQPFRR